jgi:hypothetical protein
MKKIHTALIVAPALAVVLLAPLAVMANAHGLGFDAHSIHSTSHVGSAYRHGQYGQWPLYGGVVTAAPDASDNIMTSATPETVVFVSETSRTLSCQHSREIVTVPSEQGGTRQITITRC